MPEHDSGPKYDRGLNVGALHSALNMQVYALAEFWIYLGF